MTEHDWGPAGHPEDEYEDDNVSVWGVSQKWRCRSCMLQLRVSRAVSSKGEHSSLRPLSKDFLDRPATCEGYSVEKVHEL